MKQHDAAAAHLRQPRGEVFAHSSERVVAVEVKRSMLPSVKFLRASAKLARISLEKPEKWAS